MDVRFQLLLVSVSDVHGKTEGALRTLCRFYSFYRVPILTVGGETECALHTLHTRRP